VKVVIILTVIIPKFYPDNKPKDNRRKPLKVKNMKILKSQSTKSGRDLFYKILLYYSVILLTIVILGSFYTARSGKEIVANFLFLPIVIFLWIVFIRHRQIKHNKTENKK